MVLSPPFPSKPEVRGSHPCPGCQRPVSANKTMCRGCLGKVVAHNLKRKGVDPEDIDEEEIRRLLIVHS